jgi:hypothetical protein
VRRFIDALLVDEHNSSHDHRLGFRARFGETSIDEKFIYALTFHTGLQDSLLSLPACNYSAWRVSQMKFGSAVMTEPDNDLWRIDPEE